MAFRTLILLSFLALLAWMEHGRKPRLGILYPVQVGVGGPAWRIDPLPVSDWSGCRALVLRPGKAEHGNTEEACFRKPCLLAAGRRYGMDLMLGGSVERFGDSLLVAWRLIGVESGEDLHVRAETLPFLGDDWRNRATGSLASFLRTYRPHPHEQTLQAGTDPSDRQAAYTADGRD